MPLRLAGRSGWMRNIKPSKMLYVALWPGWPWSGEVGEDAPAWPFESTALDQDSYGLRIRRSGPQTRREVGRVCGPDLRIEYKRKTVVPDPLDQVPTVGLCLTALIAYPADR